MFAAVSPGELSDAIGPIVGMIAVIAIPIVAILTSHQRKMAEMFHRPPAVDPNLQNQLLTMQRQIDELKGLLQEHIIAQDSLKARDRELTQRVQS